MNKQMIPQRNATPAEHQWDLAPLFESDEIWETMFAEVETELSSYQNYTGRLKESVAFFKEAIDFHLGLTRKIEKLYTYAHLKSDEDKSNQFYLGFHQRALNLLTRSSETAPIKRPLSRKNTPPSQKSTFFFAGTSSRTGSAPFLCLRP